MSSRQKWPSKYKLSPSYCSMENLGLWSDFQNFYIYIYFSDFYTSKYANRHLVKYSIPVLSCVCKLDFQTTSKKEKDKTAIKILVHSSLSCLKHCYTEHCSSLCVCEVTVQDSCSFSPSSEH